MISGEIVLKLGWLNEKCVRFWNLAQNYPPNNNTITQAL
jgi:hypothetical protein